MINSSMIQYFLAADPVVKFVMLIFAQLDLTLPEHIQESPK